MKQKLVWTFLIVAGGLLTFNICADTKISDVSEVWGRAIKVDAKQAFRGYRYFIYYIIDNQQYAYPILVKNKKQEKLLASWEGKLVKISGGLYSQEIVYDGTPMSMAYFVPDTISPLMLKTLSVDKNALLEPKKDIQKPEKVPVKRPIAGPQGGIHITDSAAEISVYTAAALLVGNIIYGYIKK